VFCRKSERESSAKRRFKFVCNFLKRAVLCTRVFQFVYGGKKGGLHTEIFKFSGGRAFQTSSQLPASPANAVPLFLTLLYLMRNLFLSMLLCTFSGIMGNLYFNES
jgi:hypothetical protein